MVGQASRLSIANDGQDARPIGIPRGKKIASLGLK